MSRVARPRVPRDGQAHRGALQPALRLLLLPREGRPVPGQRLPHERRGHGGLHRADGAGAARAAGDARLAGRRADADGTRLLPAGTRGRSRPRARRHGRRAHAADQRRPARRRVVRVPRRERLPRRPQHRRAARAARRLPARPRRAAGLRQGRRGRPPPPEARRRVQRALHGQRGQRRPPARGLPLLPRRARRPLHPAHPHRRGRDAAGRRPARHGERRAACSRTTTAAS